MNENIRLLRPLFKGLPIILLVMFLALLLAEKYLEYVTPMYQSTAKLKLADNQEGVPSANTVKNLDAFTSTNRIATEIEVLKSSNLLEKALKELPFNTEIYRKGKFKSVELFYNSPIIVKALSKSNKIYDRRFSVNVLSGTAFIFHNPINNQDIDGVFGKPITINEATFLISLNTTFINSKKEIKIIDSYEFEFLSIQKLMDKINENLDVSSVDIDVPVVRINFKSNVPEKTALFVNKLAETYIKDYLETRYRIANVTVDFIKQEINKSRYKLRTSENNLQNFRDRKNIINVKQESETDLRRIAQLKIQQTNVRMSLEAIKNLNKYIASGKKNYFDLAPNFEAFTDLLSTELVKKIKALQADKKDLLLVYTPENEKVKVIDEKLKDIIDYQIESIKNSERDLQIKYDALSRDINQLESVFVGFPEKEKNLEILNREFNLYENAYNILNQKRIEAEIAKSAKIIFHKIITPGKVPKKPFFPIRSVIIIVSILLGMFGSIFVIYLIYFTQAKVNDVYTIEKNSSIPVAITTPYLLSKEEIRINFLKDIVQMELKGIIQNKSILTISSYDDAKDHLFHAENFVRALQEQGRNILIIDATGQLKNVVANIDYLDYSDLKFLSYTKTAFENEIREKAKNYDFCIINNQSIKEDRLALLFMSLATENLFVLDSKKTAQKIILKMELLKEEYILQSLWFILNKANYHPSIMVDLKKRWAKYKNNTLLL
ncbi:hypothetical protein G7A72_14950 [Flavobacterium sp. Sr18]|uniref:Wzz/FepE/Etk N-terminal domain-containing protein n=1 Tax=Flavobacterium sp. Sr18 TaxID=935222 RepID=UPI0013E4882D|nr:Wzz/FepE/Etk N-terminal domain-containing protein [Flavobacterium sp. Sr18]QIH40035.1 hypothetical protein G7A72_14950 [Flavobacterium sp. Sr18]